MGRTTPGVPRVDHFAVQNERAKHRRAAALFNRGKNVKFVGSQGSVHGSLRGGFKNTYYQQHKRRFGARSGSLYPEVNQRCLPQALSAQRAGRNDRNRTCTLPARCLLTRSITKRARCLAEPALALAWAHRRRQVAGMIQDMKRTGSCAIH